MRAGFSLLELLVTLAIVGILAAIAWPGYGAVVQRAQRNDARLALLAIQHAEELRYQLANAYTATLAAAIPDGGLGLAERSPGGHYALAVSISADAQHYTATARALAGGRQATDRACASFLVDETGRLGAADADGRDTAAACWR